MSESEGIFTAWSQAAWLPQDLTVHGSALPGLGSVSQCGVEAPTGLRHMGQTEASQ